MLSCHDNDCYFRFLLAALELGCNDLEGELPTELGGLSFLETLAVNSNKLNGTMPASLGNMTMLTRLDVSNNTLTGAIPGSVANLPHLVLLDVSDNSLSGPVPTCTLTFKAISAELCVCAVRKYIETLHETARLIDNHPMNKC